MILNSNVFCSWWDFLYSTTEIQIWLSLNNLQKTSGFGSCISKIKYTSFISAIKGTTLWITRINAIYSASVVLKSSYVCNLLHHNTGHTTYIITYPVHDMTFSLLSKPTWYRQLGKSESTSYLIPFTLLGL